MSNMLSHLRGGEAKQPASATNGKPPSMPMPRAANMPPPPARTEARPYSAEALQFAQRLIDDQAEIERLKGEVDGWRGRAVAAEAEIKRLEAALQREQDDHEHKLRVAVDHHDREIAKITRARDEEVSRLTDERDFFKLGYARTRERLQVAGKVILDTLEADKREQPDKASLAAVAAAITAEGSTGPTATAVE